MYEAELSFAPGEHEALPNLVGSSCREKDLRAAACKKLRIPCTASLTCTILKKSIDARNKRNIRIIYKVQVSDAPQSAPALLNKRGTRPSGKPVVIGFGPAGMFAALHLARAGCCPIIIERGRPVDERARDVAAHFSGEPLLPFSNVQFGEGGAGTFSDGKLYSGITDHRRALVLDSFVKAGAPAEITYLAHPHIGTDRLRETVKNIRNEIIALGGTIHFERTVTDILVEKGVLRAVSHVDSSSGSGLATIDTSSAILAIGHSARDTYRMLFDHSITLTPKPFSVGVRIEHPQEWLNRAQYGAFANHPALSAAAYKLVSRTSTGRSLYTFCMCPGGFVVAGASGPGQVVTNGMSNYHRNAENANSAILVGVDSSDFSGQSVLAGMQFQEALENAAFAAGGKTGAAPCQRVADFLAGRPSTSCGTVRPSYKPGVTYTDLAPLFSPVITATIREGIRQLDHKIKGFSHPDALLTGCETRSSSPVRILRGENLCSPDVRGLYPCGEGAGYAGGIMSSAVDGLRCAERICLLESEP